MAQRLPYPLDCPWKVSESDREESGNPWTVFQESAVHFCFYQAWSSIHLSCDLLRALNVTLRAFSSFLDQNTSEFWFRVKTKMQLGNMT